VVYIDKAVTLREMLEAMEDDFHGTKHCRNKLMNPRKTPKYGGENPISEATWPGSSACWTGFQRKGNYAVAVQGGLLTMTNHAGFWKLT